MITNFGVSHVWGDLSNSPNPNPIAALPPNGTVSMAINVGPGNNDYWSVMFTAIDCWYRNMLQCDLSEDDCNSGEPVNGSRVEPRSAEYVPLARVWTLEYEGLDPRRRGLLPSIVRHSTLAIEGINPHIRGLQPSRSRLSTLEREGEYPRY